MLIPNLSPAPFDPRSQLKVLLRVSLQILARLWQSPESNSTLHIQKRKTGVYHMAELELLFCSPSLCKDRAMAVTNLLADAIFIHTERAISLTRTFCNLCLIWAYIFVHIQTKN